MHSTPENTYFTLLPRFLISNKISQLVNFSFFEAMISWIRSKAHNHGNIILMNNNLNMISWCLIFLLKDIIAKKNLFKQYRCEPEKILKK
jgi:hypothetical protein